METYGAADAVFGWVATLYMWGPVLSVLMILLISGPFSGAHLRSGGKRVLFYPLLKIFKAGERKQFLVADRG